MPAYEQPNARTPQESASTPTAAQSRACGAGKPAAQACIRQERQNLAETGSRHEVTPSLVRDVTREGDHSWITYSHHSPATIDAAIETQIEYFRRIGHSFEWKVFDHDQPPNLRERLLAHGFAAGAVEAFMVLDLHNAPEALLAPVTHDVRRVLSPDDVAEYRTVSEQAWGKERAGHVKFIADLLRDSPDEIGVYIAYVDGTPASCAWASFQHGSQFAGMWGAQRYRRFASRASTRHWSPRVCKTPGGVAIGL